jgi:hypothetical protein
LTPLILTSNPSPPLDDPSYLKRVTVRYFGKEEIHFPDDRLAIEYKNFLAANLHRERALGHFRNKFIMDNQALILDKRLTPFQKARMIWKAIYQSARLGMPDWLLNNQLEQTHMRESVEDSKGSIRSALESLIIEKCRSLDNEILRTPGYETTDRLVLLVDRKLVPYIKKLLSKDYTYFLFYRPIILELRDRFGVTKDQLPNLKALVDFIPGSVSIQHNGYWTAKTSLAKLQEYFGEKVTANTQEALT